MSVEQDLKNSKLHEVIEKILRAYPATRDSDVFLWLAYANKVHGLRNRIGDKAYYELKTMLIRELPRFESITRARRRTQEQYPELKGESAAKRKTSEQAIRDWARSN